jgi:hypothetical protein
MQLRPVSTAVQPLHSCLVGQLHSQSLLFHLATQLHDYTTIVLGSLLTLGESHGHGGHPHLRPWAQETCVDIISRDIYMRTNPCGSD